jgi:hypothetical protein
MIATISQETPMRTPRLNDERGMALAVAIFALVVIGALVAGAIVTGRLEQRTGRNTVYAAEAAQAAEAGTTAIMADWDQFNLNNLPKNVPTTLTKTSWGQSSMYASFTPTVTKLNDELFLVQSLGTRSTSAGKILSQRVVATLARLTFVTATAKAAVTVTKPVKFNGNAFEIIGNDSVPQGWAGEAGCATDADMAGIRSATTTGAADQDADNIWGNPAQVPNDPTVTNDFFNIFGDVTFDELKKSADIVLPSSSPYTTVGPSLTLGLPLRCNTGDQLNWGEPHRGLGSIAQCYNYFPIIYASGSQLQLTGGGRGQGLLLIEGDFVVAGGFEFTGLIVAKGGIKVNGNGNKITGALLAQDVSIDDDNSISGNTTLQFSSCALSKAIKGSAFAEPLAYRSWVQLY